MGVGCKVRPNPDVSAGSGQQQTDKSSAGEQRNGVGNITGGRHLSDNENEADRVDHHQGVPGLGGTRQHRNVQNQGDDQAEPDSPTF